MNSKQALMTMAEYIQATYPLNQRRMNEDTLFTAANLAAKVRKLEDERAAENRLDHSLNTIKTYRPIKVVCNCRRCEGKYYLITWRGRDSKKWPVEEGSCIYCVTLQIARLDMRYRREIDIYLIERLKEKTSVSK